MSDDRQATPEDIERIFRPIVERTIAVHGKEEAARMLKRALVASGFDPNMMRIIGKEDIS